MVTKTTFRKVIDYEETKQLLEQIRLDRGSPSGYPELDKFTGGLVKDGVTLIAGRPGMGKTSMTLNIVSRLSQSQDGTILFFSPKIWSDELTIRLLSIAMDLQPENFLNGKVSSDTIAAKFLGYYAAKKSKIKIDLSSFLTLDDLWEHCFAIPDLRLIVIDSVNTICKTVDPADKHAKRDDEEAPDVIFRSLQKLARNLDVPIVCTANLHRSLERRKNMRPRLGDLKKIGIPEELVDQIIFLYRDRYYDPDGKPEAEWILAKTVQGNTDTLRLDCDYYTHRYTELEKPN